MLHSYVDINIAAGKYYEYIQLEKPLIADVSSSVSLVAYTTDFGDSAQISTFEVMKVGATVRTRNIQSMNNIRIMDCKYSVEIRATATQQFLGQVVDAYEAKSYMVYITNSDSVKIYDSHTGGVYVDNSTVVLDGCDDECSAYGIFATNFSNVAVVGNGLMPTGALGDQHSELGSQVVYAF